MNTHTRINASARKLVTTSLRCCLMPLWRSPLRVAILAASIVVSYVVGGALSAVVYPESMQLMNFKSTAGATLQTAAAVVSPFACTWAADMLLSDVRNHRVEMVITSGCSACLYTLPKLLSLLFFLFCGGFVAAVLSFCSLEVSLGDLGATISFLDFLASLLLVYMPTISVACMIGIALGATTKSKGFSTAVYLLLWTLSLMWSSGLLGSGMRTPEVLGTFSVTGESLELIFFETPLSEETAPIEISATLWNLYVQHDATVRSAAAMNPFFLLTVAAAMLITLSVYMRAQWLKSAERLLFQDRTTALPERELPSKLLGFRATKARMVAWPFILSLVPMLLLFFTDDPSVIACFSMYSLTPVLFSPFWSSCLLNDETTGTYELTICLPHYRIICTRRLMIPLVAALLSLLIQFSFWSPFLATDMMVSLFSGAVPVLFMGGIASTMASLTQKADIAGVIASVVWTALNLSPVRDFFITLPGRGLYPFMAAYLTHDQLPVQSLLIVLAGALVMIIFSIIRVTDIL